METAISTLSVMPSTKEQVMTFTKKYKDELLAGTHDPLEQLARLKYIEKFIKNILTDDDIDYLMVAELEKYGKEKDIPISGFKMNIKETGVEYFSNHRLLLYQSAINIQEDPLVFIPG